MNAGDTSGWPQLVCFGIFAANMTISSSLRETILTQLRDGHWKAGDRLPTERELADGYRVSRTTVRRALADLKQQGLIEQTVGSGTFVAQ
jgi:GntR family transcriptional regulator, uxu operon transcriptional repressor